MKIMKFPFKFISWFIAIVVVLVLTLPLWIGVVKPVANAVVPKVTGTAFNLGAFALNPYVGKLSVSDVRLSNPEGFDQKMAATLGTLDVSVDMGTVASDTVIVRDIMLKDVFVSYVSNAKGQNNFAVIAKNAKGGEKAEEKVKVKGEGEQKKVPSQTSQTAQAKPSKKVIVDHVLIENVLVQLGPVAVPVPKIELTGIGRKSGGVTMEEAWSQISTQVMASLNKIGEFANQLGKMGIDLGNLGIEHSEKAAKALKNIDVKGVTDAFKGGTKAVGDGGGKAVDAVGESANKAVNAIKGLFK